MLGGEVLSIPDINTHVDAHPVCLRQEVDAENVDLDFRAGDEEEETDQPVLSMLLVPLEGRGERAGDCPSRVTRRGPKGTPDRVRPRAAPEPTLRGDAEPYGTPFEA